MHGPGAADMRSEQERRTIQIAFPGRCRTDAERLVSETHMAGIRIGFRVDCDCLQSQLPASALNAQRDLSTIGDQDLVEHDQRPIRNSGWADSASSPALTRMARTVPVTSDSIELNIFIASMVQSTWPCVTVSPTRTNGASPGAGVRCTMPNIGASITRASLSAWPSAGAGDSACGSACESACDPTGIMGAIATPAEPSRLPGVLTSRTLSSPSINSSSASGDCASSSIKALILSRSIIESGPVIRAPTLRQRAANRDACEPRSQANYDELNVSGA